MSGPEPGAPDPDGTKPADAVSHAAAVAADGLDPDEERINAWLDRQLPAADAKAFEAELADDPQRGKEVKTLASVLGKLRELPKEHAPKDLLADVQADIRQRSAGRYFGYHWKYRFPWEALLNSLLLIFAVVVYVTAQPAPKKLIPIEAKSFLVAGSDLGVGARILGDYGAFTREPDVPGGWIYLSGEVKAHRMEALRSELSLYPSMRLDREEEAGDVFKVTVAIKR